jgi:precorrin-6Y C5,15-methyltransferase (decarboxylating)
MALSMLAPRAGDIAWDIGAGCGGISVEWARWNRRGQVFAVELNEDRVRHLQTNRKRFGVTNNLEIVHQRAPEALTNLPDPNAVYLGGSDGNLGELIEICWQRLQRRGRLVAAAVTEESRAALRTFAGSNDVHWTQLAIARDATLGGQHIMRPQLPVLLLQRCKS